MDECGSGDVRDGGCRFGAVRDGQVWSRSSEEWMDDFFVLSFVV